MENIQAKIGLHMFPDNNKESQVNVEVDVDEILGRLRDGDPAGMMNLDRILLHASSMKMYAVVL
jgi:hypothetical protein